MDRLAVTAITNFVLAGETLFLAGRLSTAPAEPGSPAWFWRSALLLLGASALLGGIDHGLLEPLGRDRRKPVQRANWLLIGLIALCAWMTAATQFLPDTWFAPALAVAFLQWALYAARVLRGGSYRLVVANYLPAVALLLGLSVAASLRGAAHWSLAVGLVLSLVASAVQAAGVDRFDPLDRDGLYHVGGMVAVVFLYAGFWTLSSAR